MSSRAASDLITSDTLETSGVSNSTSSHTPNPLPFWLHAIHWLLRLGLAGVFVAAAFHKVIDPAGFAVSVHRFDLLPDVMIHPMAILLPWLEITAGMTLLFARSWRQAATWLLFCLMLIFTMAAASAKWRGLNIDCGCFSSESPSPIGWWLFVRNGILISAILILAWLDGHIFMKRARSSEC